MDITGMLGGIINATTQRGNMTKREARDMAAVIWDINDRLEKLEAAHTNEVLEAEEKPKKTARKSASK